MSTTTIATLVSLYAPSHEILDLHADGDVVLAVSSGGVDVYEADGAWLARLDDLPSRRVTAVHLGAEWVVGTEVGAFAWRDGWVPVGPARPVAGLPGGAPVGRDGVGGARILGAIAHGGGVVSWTADGRLLLPTGPLTLPGPVADVAVVGGELRVATHVAAVIVGAQGTRVLPIPATAAGPVWGTAEGALLDDDGRRVAAVPAAVRAVLERDGALWVGTGAGLFRVADGLRRLDPPGPCGAFVTGVDLVDGAPVIATFQDGACRLGPTGWTALDLPTPLTNDVLVRDGAIWVATAAGLARVDHAGTAVFGEVVDEAPRGAPGLNHPGANALADGPGGLWVADVLGPVRVGDDGAWQRHRWGVSGHSYQAIAACPWGDVWLGAEDDGLAFTGPGPGPGTRNGRSRWRHVSVSHGLPEDWVMAVACAGPGAAWVGTYRRGVGRIDARGWHPVPGLEREWVQALAVDGETLWVGTADGLIAVRGDRIERLSRADVHALRVADGDLWVGTRAGLERWAISEDAVASELVAQCADSACN
jgi:ligand-binding sensor domain-containing protein